MGPLEFFDLECYKMQITCRQATKTHFRFTSGCDHTKRLIHRKPPEGALYWGTFSLFGLMLRGNGRLWRVVVLESQKCAGSRASGPGSRERSFASVWLCGAAEGRLSLDGEFGCGLVPVGGRLGPGVRQASEERELRRRRETSEQATTTPRFTSVFISSTFLLEPDWLLEAASVVPLAGLLPSSPFSSPAVSGFWESAVEEISHFFKLDERFDINLHKILRFLLFPWWHRPLSPVGSPSGSSLGSSAFWKDQTLTLTSTAAGIFT